MNFGIFALSCNESSGESVHMRKLARVFAASDTQSIDIDKDRSQTLNLWPYMGFKGGFCAYKRYSKTCLKRPLKYRVKQASLRQLVA